MRFLVMVKAIKEWDGELPPAAMGAFNETLVRDGVMLDAAEGLQPSSKGVRISYASQRPIVTDGPFTETKELVAGFGSCKRARRKSSSSDSCTVRSTAANRSRSGRFSKPKTF